MSLNKEDHTADFFWRAEGGTFASENFVGLKSLLIYPLNFEKIPHGRVETISDLPRDCVIVKTNLIEAGRFNSRKVIATFPAAHRTAHISYNTDSPGKV